MILLKIFWVWFQIGLFSIGGGYAALPIIKNMVVDNYGWITMAQFADLVVIDEMAPGPIILNSATFVGTQVAGFPGAVIATTGYILGPAIIISVIAHFYFKYKEMPIVKNVLNMLHPVIAALIASAGLSIIILSFWNGSAIGISSVNLIAVGISIIAFIVLRKFKLNPIFIIIGCGVLGGLIYSFL